MNLVQINERLQSKDALGVLQWAAEEFGPQVTIASSFGAEDMVLIDLAAAVQPKIKVFTLDTGRLNEETYQVMDAVRRKYGVEIESYFPDTVKVEALERSKGFYSFRESVENRKECCQIRKVEPLKRALKGMKAWVTGLRREQSITRVDIQKVESDASNGGIYKINPLVTWTEKEIWDHIKKNSVPYNRLHDEGYPSIGCAPCTRAVKAGEDVRAGRWWWESPEHKECGLHRAPKSHKE